MKRNKVQTLKCPALHCRKEFICQDDTAEALDKNRAEFEKHYDANHGSSRLGRDLKLE